MNPESPAQPEQPHAAQPDDNLNPYASPLGPERDALLGLRESPILDLTEEGAREAQAIVEEAESVFVAIVLIWCFCPPLWLGMLPWYVYRLVGWYRLRDQFAELRSPYSSSPHGELATQFIDARIRLVFGIIAGSVLWALLLVAWALAALWIR